MHSYATRFLSPSRIPKFLNYYSSFPHKLCFNMNQAYLRHINDRCDISFRYINEEYSIDRVFNFSRQINENVQTCLDRIRTNVEKEFAKKLRKTSKRNKATTSQEQEDKTSQMPEISIKLLRNEEHIGKDVAFQGLLVAESVKSDKLSLFVLDEQYEVHVNAPFVTQITLPTSILANFYVYPSKLELLFTDKEKCEFRWYRGKMKNDDPNCSEWQEVGQGFTYKVASADIGHALKIQCIPKNEEKVGPSAEFVSKCIVQADPGSCPFDWRHQFTRDRLTGNQTGNSFRVVSYNLLADLYADSDYSRQMLFPYCPPYALNIDYRKQLFIKELLGYNADIMCLCEVDAKIFDLDLEPFFKEYGFNGNFQRKGTTAEGLATFYQQSRFEALQKHGINIGENIKVLSEFAQLWNKIKDNQKLVDRIIDRSTAIQVTVLRQLNSNKILVVANTHLYFHPDADHVRLLQIGFSMLYVERIVREVKAAFTDANVALIFCGDFNSVPECGIYKLMTEKFVPENFVDWNSNKEEAVQGVSLRQPFNMESAYAADLPFTNFTPGFSATIDYIFFEADKIKAIEVIPTPSEEELLVNVAIPSPVMPSDHISLVANLSWLEE